MMRLHPNKPIIIWIYYKLKLHLLIIYLTYWTSEFNLTYLNMLGTIRLAYSWATSISEKAYFTTKCWISYGILNTVLRVENRMAGWVQNGCKCIGSLPLWLCYWLGAVALHRCPASCKSVIPHTTILEDQNSKYSSYWMHRLLLHHHKSWKIQSQTVIIWEQFASGVEGSKASSLEEKEHLYKWKPQSWYP